MGAWAGRERVRIEPFDAVELFLGRLWGEEEDDDAPSGKDEP